MSPIVLAVPYIPPTPPAPPFVAFGMLWTGWDGSVWDLVGSETPTGLALMPGVRGLGRPPSKRWSKSAPGLAGSRHLGHQVLDRDVYLPLRIYSDVSSQEWVEYARAFWNTMDEDRPGTLTVIHPDGNRRSLRLRYVSEDDSGADIDPSLVGWSAHGLNLLADEPFWFGEPVSTTFQAHDTEPFYPEGGGFLTVSDTSTIDSSTISNPGTEDAWATWRISATTSLVIGVGTSSIVIPFPIDSDRLLVVDSAPSAQTAKEIDAPPPDSTPDEIDAWVADHLPAALDRTKELGDATEWAPIAAGDAVELSISMVGAGSAQAIVVPQYRRAS